VGYKHIIWDWNGTLLNDVAECVSVVNELLRERGLPHLTVERYRDEVDFPIVDFYKRLGFTFETETYEEVAKVYMAGYIRHVPRCSLQAGAIEVLEQFTKAGFTHSVLSAYHQKRLEEAVDYFGLRKWFTGLVGLDDYYAHSKKDNGKRWLAKQHMDPREVLFVGDMLHDFEVSQAMGVDCVLLTYGHQSRGRLSRCGVPLFDSLSEMASWLTR